MGKVMTLREYFEEVKARECHEGEIDISKHLEMQLLQQCGLGLGDKIELVDSDVGEEPTGQCEYAISWHDADSDLYRWDTEGEETIHVCNYHCEDSAMGPYAKGEFYDLDGSVTVYECFDHESTGWKLMARPA